MRGPGAASWQGLVGRGGRTGQHLSGAGVLAQPWREGLAGLDGVGKMGAPY